MKRFQKLMTVTAAFIFLFTYSASAQDAMKEKKDMKAKTITLTQTPGEFAEKDMTLKPGNYIFQVDNQEVGKDVGFYLHPKGSEKPVENSDKAGLIPNNESRSTGVVSLEKGEYVYSCPLNPTEDYTITVK